MVTKLIIIMLAAAAFGWGLSTLVHHSEQTLRPGTTPSACNEWTGSGCATQFER